MKDNVSHLILENLLLRDDFSKAVLPHLKEEYFDSSEERTVYRKIKDYTEKYTAIPTPEVISIELNNDPSIIDDTFEFFDDFVNDLEKSDKSLDWLIDVSESFCKDRALYIALEKAINIAQEIDDSSGLSRGALPVIFQDALNVSFDQQIGHDYINDKDARYEYYTTEEERIKFDLDELNDITRGGLPKKTLNVAMGPSGCGKTLFLCHLAAAWVKMGHNVLYITLEMAEERIAERIDANLMDIDISDIRNLSKEQYDDKISNIMSKSIGRLRIKEYPTGSAHAGHFRFLLQELKMKERFIPDIICIDYINICSSSRKRNSNEGSYGIVKSISEELRGLAVEFDVPIFSLTQTGRTGFDASDISATDVSESIGLVQTVDMLLGLITNDDLKKMGHMIIKTVKNSRYGEDGTFHTIGVNRSKMQMYNIEKNDSSYIDVQSNDNESIQSNFSISNKKKKFKEFEI